MVLHENHPSRVSETIQATLQPLVHASYPAKDSPAPPVTLLSLIYELILNYDPSVGARPCERTSWLVCWLVCS